MARNWLVGTSNCTAAVAVIAAAALVGVAPPGLAQTASPTTTNSTAPPNPNPVVPAPTPPAGSSEFDTSIVAKSVSVGGPEASTATDGAANFVFTGAAGQVIFVRANRPWSMQDPNGDPVSLFGNTVRLVHSGRYLVNLEKGLLAPATLLLNAVSPTPVVMTSSVGQPIVFDAAQPREQYARVSVRGGVRYRIVAAPGQNASFCATDVTGLIVPLGCVTSPSTATLESAVSFVPASDQALVVSPDFVPTDTVPFPTVRIEELASDVFIDATVAPITELNPEVGQRAVIPFWGTPAQRAVLSSPIAANVSPWGQPWIDKEAGGAGTIRVYATPVSFNPKQAPFIAWPHGTAAQRFGVYRGEDTAVVVPPTGQPVSVRNKPWFAGVGSLAVEPGGRYVLQITGTSIRPLSLGLRDPAGKLTSNFAPWQWTEDGVQQRAVTSFTADRGGKWAIEIRPSGNAVKDVSVSLLKVGGGGSFEGAVDVDEVLAVGDETDVQLSPNEFARFTLKLDDSTPQIIQPEVLKYRNKTFQASAVDMSLWDSRGRLVWSNNRTVDEEVLSGRLGTERDLTERFATVASADAYTLIIDPLVNVSGRFRVSVKSSPVISDVPLATAGSGVDRPADGVVAPVPVPVLPGGTETGVVEVRTPTRYRVLGTTACLETTSTLELAVEGNPKRCLQSGESWSLPVGVHRFRFPEKVTGRASFSAVPADTPDVRPTVNATVGDAFSIPTGGSIGAVRFSLTAGQRVLLPGSGVTLVEPDGTVRRADAVFVATLPGTHELRFRQSLATASRTIVILRTPVEVASTSLVVGAKKASIFRLVNGTRIEARVVVPKPAKGIVSGVGFDLFASPPGQIQFLYAADQGERRFFGSQDEVALPPGSYRFVFAGDGAARIRLSRLTVLDEFAGEVE